MISIANRLTSSDCKTGAHRGALQATLVLGAGLLIAVIAGVESGGIGALAAGCAILVFAVGSGLVFRALSRTHVSLTAPSIPHARYGAANSVTQLRLAISSLLAGWTVEAMLNLPSVGAVLILMVSVAAALDAVDGRLARAQGLASPLGARFDMEVDAFFLLLLSLMCWLVDKAGVWVLMAGLMRYLFVAAAWVWPWLAAPLPASRRRQAICVIQIVCLIVALIPAMTGKAATFFAAAGLILLAASFGKDVFWLYRARR